MKELELYYKGVTNDIEVNIAANLNLSVVDREEFLDAVPEPLYIADEEGNKRYSERECKINRIRYSEHIHRKPGGCVLVNGHLQNRAALPCGSCVQTRSLWPPRVQQS